MTNPNPDNDIKDRDFTHAGRIDLSKLDRKTDLLLDNDQTQYFVCGPTSFITNMQKGLADLGVDQDRIKVELFGVGLPQNS